MGQDPFISQTCEVRPRQGTCPKMKALGRIGNWTWGSGFGRQSPLLHTSCLRRLLPFILLTSLSKGGHLREGWGKHGFSSSFFLGKSTAKFPMEIITRDRGQWPGVLLTQKLSQGILRV